MADKYSTIQQHQPIRVPETFTKQERAMVIQLDEIFDDIYRRFGRLRIEDMGAAFRKRLEDDEGNIAQLIVDVGNIEISVADKYDKVSGITINSSGISITGSKYLQLNSGCELDIESGGYINVRSGGNLKVASGGNVDIRGAGTLSLTGSTVEIKSGSTFDVDATNFKISSEDKKVETGEWQLNRYGLVGDNGESAIAFGRYGVASLTGDGPRLLIQAQPNEDSGLFYFSFYKAYSGAAPAGRLQVSVGDPALGNTNYGAYIAATKYNGSLMTFCKGMLGTNQGEWDIWADEVKYYTLTQRSSREVKHDIVDLPSVGDRLDRLRPVTFVYDNDANENKRMGLIYEDTMEIMPEICTGDESDKAINYVELIPALLKEIQDLRGRVAELEGRT